MMMITASVNRLMNIVVMNDIKRPIDIDVGSAAGPDCTDTVTITCHRLTSLNK